MERKVRDGLEEVETEMEDSPKCRERTRDENERLVRSDRRERDGGREEENNLPPGPVLSAGRREHCILQNVH